MFAKIFLKKLMILSLSVLIIGALTNCGGSSGGGGGSGGSGGDNPTTKKPVEKAPLKPTCSISDQLDIKVSINDADEQCLLKNKNTLDFVLNSIASEYTRTWDNKNVKVVLQISEDATAKPGCAIAAGKSVNTGWVLDFSSSTSCKITVSLKNDSETQAVYTLKMVGYGISEAADFKSAFFASEPARFVLTKDIELTEEKASFASRFKGKLDGAGHEISGFSIDAADADNVGLISQIALRADDSTVEIKNLTLGITKLVGQDNVGGLIGKVNSDVGARAVQIKNVTVEFASALLQCTNFCGGLVGYAESSVHFSGIAVKGEVSASGKQLGGVVGIANPSQLTDVTAHFNMNYSGERNVGLVAGVAQGNSILINIDASGMINCEKGCNTISGVVGRLGSSQLSQAKSNFKLKASSGASSIGGIVGQSVSSKLTAVYGKLTAEVVGDAEYFGSITGSIRGSTGVSSMKRAFGYLDVTSNGAFNTSGSLIGATAGESVLQQVFAAGSITTRSLQGVGQMIGEIDGAELNADNCYTGAFTGDKIPAAAVGQITTSASASFTKCYTRATNFVRDDDLSKATFGTVYATTSQTDSRGVTSGTLPELNVSDLNGDGSLWTDQFGEATYKYPMLAYPKEDMGPVSAADWFEFQIKDNEKK